MEKNTEKDIKKAIDLMIETEVQHDDLIEVFIDYGIDYNIVEDLFIFLPIVFCRIMLPQVNFPTTFLEINGKIEAKKTFDSIAIYGLILKIAQEYISKLSSKDILKIAASSAEFKAINQVLLQEEGDDNLLEKIKLTEMIITR